ncbi:MAG: FHA domain-containing protein [Deltaproteobacteria bacterium]|nr:MAG: FHA domain-containing protein [Deltaproteobacteria bacterium]
MPPFGRCWMKAPIEAFDRDFRFGPVQSFKNIALLPIVKGKEPPFGFLTLSQGLAEGLVEVTESPTGPSVPELSLYNRSERKLFILDGEELVGGKQNRVVNASFLIPEKSHVVLPVSCVEQRRWQYNDEVFRTSDTLLSIKGRSRKTRDVTKNLHNYRSYHANQSHIWSTVTEHTLSMEIHSLTDAMNDIFRIREEDIGTYMCHFHPIDGQVGWSVFINGLLVGIEIFGTQDLFCKFWRKLLKSYTLDALSDYGGSDFPQVDHARVTREKLEMSFSLPMRGFSTVGEGEDLRFEQGDLSGFLLRHEGRPVHLSIFLDIPPAEGERGYRLWKRDRHLIDPKGLDPATSEYRATFEVVSGENQGRYYGLCERVLIGRSLEADLLLLDSHVSRKHAILTYSPLEGYTIRDLKSSNGTRVNHVRIETCRLAPGDLVGFGKKTLFRFDLLASAAQTAENPTAPQPEAFDRLN